MSPKKSKYSSSMVDKTRVQVDPTENSFGRKVLGMGFALVGFLLILGVIILNIISNVEPKLDEELSVPKLDEIVSYTNKDKITISGKVSEGDQVILYVNDEMLREVIEVEDEKFSYSYEIVEEGEYVFQAVTVEGFPFRRGSEKSESIKVVVDWTAPSADVKIEYASEVENGLVTVTGEVESNIFVRLLGNEEIEHETESDDEGYFEFVNIRLVEGENEFRVELEDKAGNKNVLARRVVVTSLIDGPEVVDGEIVPEASGDLIRAMGQLFNNRLMMIFGALALVSLIVSSGMVVVKKKSEV